MAYSKHGSIIAVTYNNLATTLNYLFNDSPYSNAGYGQTGTIANVSAGSAITAAQWNSIFSTISALGTHQGISTSPLPASVSTGQNIAAFNNYVSSSTLKDIESLLTANRLIAAPSQLTTNTGTPNTTSTSWTTGIQYTWSVDFGSWDNARYFFNTGGSVTFSMPTNGGYTTGSSFWDEFLPNMGNVKFAWGSTIPQNSQTSQVGFYNLTTSYQEILRKNPANVAPYNNNFLSVSAKLTAAAGTNGQIDFQIQLVDNDGSPPATKTGATIIVSNIVSSGVIPYSGTAMTITPGSWTTTFTAPSTYTPVTVTSNLYSLTAHIAGPGTATSPNCIISSVGGSGTYTYAWSVNSGTTVSFSNATSATTNISCVLNEGDVESGTVQCIITDTTTPTPFTTTIFIPWAMNSNNINS